MDNISFFIGNHHTPTMQSFLYKHIMLCFRQPVFHFIKEIFYLHITHNPLSC